LRQKFESVNDYLKSLEPGARKTLQAVRKTILAAAKGLEESISYNIPAYKFNGKAVVFIAGFKNHCSLYPLTAEIKKALGENLKNFTVKGSTLQYPIGKPLPAEIIKKIIDERLKILDF